MEEAEAIPKRCGLAAALALAALAPGQAAADLLYTWHAERGPALSASFWVQDTAIAGGMLTPANMMTSPGFRAATSTGVFTNLTSDSALQVDTVSGAVLDSTNLLTATNATDTLLLSATGWLIPTTPLESHGLGYWTVTRVAVGTPVLSLTFLGLTNGQAQLQVSASPDMAFTVQASTDFAQWTPILTSQTSVGVAIVADPAPATSQARFYRAVSQ